MIHSTHSTIRITIFLYHDTILSRLFMKQFMTKYNDPLLIFKNYAKYHQQLK